MFIHIFVVGSERQMCNVKTRNGLSRSVQGHPRSLIVTNRKRLCNFLLVFNSKLGRILHSFGDTAAYRSKNRKNRPFEPTPLSQIALAGGNSLRIIDESYLIREWNHRAISRWRNHDAIALSGLVQYRLWRTDGQTCRWGRLKCGSGKNEIRRTVRHQVHLWLPL